MVLTPSPQNDRNRFTKSNTLKPFQLSYFSDWHVKGCSSKRMSLKVRRRVKRSESILFAGAYVHLSAQKFSVQAGAVKGLTSMNGLYALLQGLATGTSWD